VFVPISVGDGADTETLHGFALQEGRKKGREWGDEFARVMQQAIKDISRTTNDKVRSSVARTIKVWEERRVFTSALIKVLRDTLEAAKPSSGAGSGSSAGELDPASQRKLQVKGKCQHTVVLVAPYSWVNCVMVADSCIHRQLEYWATC
jgi:hypothetical protein